MKRLFTAVLVLLVCNVYSQKEIVWFDCGLKAQWGASALYNKAIVDAPNYDYKLGFGSAYSFGGKFGINFGYNGLAIDLMYGKASQEFDIDNSEVVPTIEWKALDLYLLYRNAKNLGYFEIGPKVSFIRKVEGSAGAGTGTTDLSESYNDKEFSAVLGFGALLLGNDGRFSGQLGLRFEYGIGDLVSNIGQDMSAPLNDPAVYADGYQGSHPIFAGLVFELNWGIGYYGVAQCGGRSKFIMF